jgi:hypothetical protein
MKDDQQRSNFVRISNYYKYSFLSQKFPLMYLAFNSLYMDVDERLIKEQVYNSILQERWANGVQHIGQHIILLG